jgi:archaellum component FlaC
MGEIVMIKVMSFNYFGLPGLHWLISFAVPLILALAWIYYANLNRLLRKKFVPIILDLQREIEQYQRFDIDLLPEIGELFHKCGNPALAQAFARLMRDHERLYQRRWLPDPAQELTIDRLFSGTRRSCINDLPAFSLLCSGLIASLVSHLLLVQLPIDLPDLSAILPWPPLAIGVIASIMLAVQARQTARLISSELNQLCQVISRHVPVFSDQAGLALLIDSFYGYEHRVEHSLVRLTDLTDNLVSHELAEGIRGNIEQMMNESVGPALRQSAALLGDLATELTSRQERGMTELASQFAKALAAEVAAQMGPVHREISQISSLMVDVKQYIEYAMRALETVRQDTKGLLADTNTSLQKMTMASQQMAEHFARSDKQLEQLGTTAEKMASLYSGQELSLNTTLTTLAGQMDALRTALGQTVRETARLHDQAIGETTRLHDQAVSDMARLHDQALSESTRFHDQTVSESTRLHDQVVSESSILHDQAVSETAHLLDQIRQVAAGQQEASANYLAVLQEQVLQLGNGLQTRLAELLTAIRGETREISGQTTQLYSQTHELNQMLEQALDHFTRTSSQYVEKTLHQFDQGLAEVIERLAFTTTEIRDAVDALPAALHKGPQYQ